MLFSGGHGPTGPRRMTRLTIRQKQGRGGVIGETKGQKDNAGNAAAFQAGVMGLIRVNKRVAADGVLGRAVGGHQRLGPGRIDMALVGLQRGQDTGAPGRGIALKDRRLILHPGIRQGRGDKMVGAGEEGAAVRFQITAVGVPAFAHGQMSPNVRQDQCARAHVLHRAQIVQGRLGGVVMLQYLSHERKAGQTGTDVRGEYMGVGDGQPPLVDAGAKDMGAARAAQAHEIISVVGIDPGQTL